MKFNTKQHRKGRPPKAYTILERLNDDGTWSKDDKQPALAFHCVLGHYHYAISECCSCGFDIDRCPKEYAMAHVCSEHGAASGAYFDLPIHTKKKPI